jgi:hypothetical protein
LIWISAAIYLFALLCRAPKRSASTLLSYSPSTGAEEAGRCGSPATTDPFVPSDRALREWRFIMVRRFAGLAVFLVLAGILSACLEPVTPKRTIYYGTGSYTVGVYEDPWMNFSPGSK